MPWPGEALREDVGVVFLDSDALQFYLAVAQLVLKSKITQGEMFHSPHAPPGHHRPGGRGVAEDSQMCCLPQL
eukprot:10387248-Heterocapsa_arctica.AAC.1